MKMMDRFLNFVGCLYVLFILTLIIVPLVLTCWEVRKAGIYGLPVLAIIVPIIVALVRWYIKGCVLGLPAVETPTEDNPPTVSIEGEEPLLLFQETATTGSPSLELTATGTPAGGTYKWSVLVGAEKVRLESDLTQSSLEVKPLQPSESQGDVVLQVTYTSADGTATAQVPLTIHIPHSALRISTKITTFNGLSKYGYDFTARYRILDQFGVRFPGGFLSLDEDLSILSNPYNTVFEEREYLADSDAEYDDHYTLIFDNQPVPSDYQARIRQIVRAEGVQILDHTLLWSNKGVDFE